jgi:large subunit ribosomal protein L15
VNSDPALLDQFYIRMLGNGGDQVLSDELKWLAVTHKSFDQGRRGFNDRLAFLGMGETCISGSIRYCLLTGWIGKRIVQLQASLALVQNPEAANVAVKTDPHGRTPFSHPALDGLRSLSPETKSFLTDRSKLAELAQKYEMQNVLRWTPRKVRYCPMVYIFLSSPANILCLLA